LEEAAAGGLGWEELLRRVGHRGSEEMELAKPRWREAPEELRAMLDSLAQHRASAPQGQAREAGEERDPLSDLREALGTAVPPEAQLRTLAEELRFARVYLGLRESGKHWMMAGYEEIRRCLVEVGRRSGLEDGVFFLEYGELSDLATGADLSELAAERRRDRDLRLSLPCPRVLFSDDLDRVGRPEATDGQPFLSGAAVASGVVEGPALVARRPEDVPEEAHGFVLVCPSTDPGWSAIFLRARGLVMETGGVLSHGAIVAREFGLPAVVNLPGLLDRIPQGARLRVDGDLGTVAILRE
jgi:pyruvate,water dikinase